MIALAAVIGVAVGLLALRIGLVIVVVDGPSMEPTIRPGDRLLVRRTRGYRLRVGQVAVLRRRPPGRHAPADVVEWSQRHPWLVKRVAAVAGDRVPAEVAVGGTVPRETLVILGDNRAVSRDSRQDGFYAVSEVVGVVVARIAAAGSEPDGPGTFPA